MAVDTSTVQVVMPAMGDSVAEGTVLEWHKQEGDTVSADETIVEISTDKVDAEVPAPVSGTVTRIHAAEGDTVAVGALLAEIATNGDGAAAGAENGSPPTPTAAETATPVSGESPPTTAGEAVASAATEAEGVAAAEQAAGKTVDIVTPTGGESVTEGTILEWSVKVGDAVKDGDTVVEISTDKVDMELPAPADGTITEILARDGETVTVGQVIGRMSVGGASAGGAPSGNGGSVASTAPSAQAGSAGPTASPAAGTPTPSAGNGADTNASPVARRVAAAEGVDLASIQGTARGGRITKADVLNHGNGAPAAPARAAAGRGAADQGRRRRAGPLHGPEPVHPDGDLLPHLDRHHARRAAQAAQERRQARLLHPPDRLRHRARGHRRHAGDGQPLRGDRRQALPPRRRRRQPRPRRRRREEGRHPHTDGPGHPRRRPHELRAVPGRLQRAGGEGPHQHADR